MGYEQYGYLERKNGGRRDAIQVKVGDIFPTNSYGDVKVISFEMVDNKEQVRVRFLETGGVRLVKLSCLKIGQVKELYCETSYPKGMVIHNKKYGYFRILNNPDNSLALRDKRVDTKFLNTGAVNRSVMLTHTLKGTARDYYAPIVEGVGYVGKGKHSPMEHCGLVKTKCYDIWRDMLRRTTEGERFTTYHEFGITVCPEWHNFQNFAEWYYSTKNHDKNWHLDKDLISYGNTEYAPENCCFIPREVNAFYVHDRRGKGYLRRGVRYEKGVLKVTVAGFENEPLIEEVGFNDEESAFLRYKELKEERARLLADKWDGILDDRVIHTLRTLDIQPQFPD